MANHLRELVEACDKGEFSVGKITSQRWPEKARAFVLEHSHSAISFYTDSDSMVGMKVVPEIAKLPYPVCWMESKVNGSTFGALLTEEGGNVGGHAWARMNGHWFFLFAFMCRNGVSEFQCLKEDQGDKAAETVAFIRAFLTAMACTNVRRVEHRPDAKLQKARAKRGKQPLFSFWTLELDLSRPESSESQGGTHASPRLHLRRGHARQYAAGKWTWVQPCVVGNKAAGMIHKEYEVRA